MAGDDACDIAIVGAGAAGLATAIFARRLNPSLTVLLLDSSARPGAKILVSGGSRCNVTNVTVSERDFNGGNPAVIRRVLKAFSASDVTAWFRSLGVALHEEAHGKLFPNSNRSRDVLNALLDECAASGAELRTGTQVTGISSGDALTLATTRGEIRPRAVVMATGGMSLPKTGSDGGGLEIARRLGHRIVPTTPALVPLVLSDDPPMHRALSGVSHEAELSLWVDGAISLRIRGSLLWTHFGLSGPVVLDMSRHWLRAQIEGKDACITVNLSGGKSFDGFERDWTTRAASKSIHGLLTEVVPAAVASMLIERLSVSPTMQVANLPRDERRRLVHALVEWPVTIAESRGYNYAEATAGGVALDEVDPATLASRRCPGLYFVGEILDVDGRIGGFNFQWAWSTARVAARALARRAHRGTVEHSVR
jgi:predicted Rossmann fold flavoprotein